MIVRRQLNLDRAIIQGSIHATALMHTPRGNDIDVAYQGIVDYHLQHLLSVTSIFLLTSLSLIDDTRAIESYIRIF
jgi:hypothetical protein